MFFSLLLLSFHSNSNDLKVVDTKNISFVIPPTYDTVQSFSEGLAAVKINHKWGFIDKTGKVAIEPQFNPWQAQFNSYYSDGLVAVNFNNGKDDKTNTDGNDVTNLLWGFADKKGNLVIPPKFIGDLTSPPFFKEGLASVMASSMYPNNQYLMGVGAKYGYIDKTGEFVIKPIYEKALFFENGLAIVGLNGKEGFINKKGEVVIPLIYDSVNRFSDGVSIVSIDKKYFYIDVRGNKVTDKTFEFLSPFSEGLAKFMENEKSGFINLKAEVVIKPFLVNESIFSMFGSQSFSEGLCLVEFGNSDKKGSFSSGKFGYMDKKGKIVINPKYDSAKDFKNGKAIVELDGKSFFINTKGERISPLYKDLYYESDGLVKVRVGENFNYKYGFIKY